MNEWAWKSEPRPALDTRFCQFTRGHGSRGLGNASEGGLVPRLNQGAAVISLPGASLFTWHVSQRRNKDRALNKIPAGKALPMGKHFQGQRDTSQTGLRSLPPSGWTPARRRAPSPTSAGPTGSSPLWFVRLALELLKGQVFIEHLLCISHCSRC